MARLDQNQGTPRHIGYFLSSVEWAFEWLLWPGIGDRKVINTRYRKLSGNHLGRSYVVVAPYGEIESPMRWMLHMEGNDGEKLIVAEDELADPRLWQSLE